MYKMETLVNKLAVNKSEKKDIINGGIDIIIKEKFISDLLIYLASKNMSRKEVIDILGEIFSKSVKVIRTKLKEEEKNLKAKEKAEKL